MSRPDPVVLALAIAAVAGGCAPLAPSSRETAPRHGGPIRWIVVERQVGDLYGPEVGGQGVIDPEAVVLVLEPLPSGPPRWQAEVTTDDFHVEVLSLVPPKEAGAGEIVTATVRVAGDRPEAAYRLTAVPCHSSIRLLDPSSQRARGNTPVQFRFTSLTGGRARVRIDAEIERPHWTGEDP